MSYICAYRLTFKDGGEPEFGFLGRGTKEECDRIMEVIPAVYYPGDRPVESCHIGVFEEPPNAE